MSIYNCHCGTSWETELEKDAPEVLAKFHDKHHAIWEQRSFEGRRQFANAMFGLPEDTQWAEKENK